jgi:DNA replication initiation complex subunit (GINS family)
MKTDEIKADFFEQSNENLSALKAMQKKAEQRGHFAISEVLAIEIQLLKRQKVLIYEALVYAQNSNAFLLQIDDLQTLINNLDNGK